MSARKMTELTVAVKSQAGELARVLGLASQAGANVIAFCGYERASYEGGAEILIVPDNADRAKTALEKAGYTCTANPVVAIAGAAGKGMGARMAEKFAKASINILYSYASSSGAGQSTAIFRVEKPDAALKAIKS
jgi:hypothetical protein